MVVIAVAFLGFGCGADEGAPGDGGLVGDGGAGADAGRLPDAARVDGATDGGSVDSGSVDGGSVDGGSVDGGSVDSGSVDSGSVDSGSVDSGSVDSGSVDSGSVDSGSVDSGSVDAGSTDAGRDAGADAGPMPRATAVASGGVHSCALYNDGRVFCWGTNDDGAVGVSGAGILAPVQVPGVVATAIAAGDSFTCAMVGNIGGSGVTCWGRLNTSVSYSGPTMVAGLIAPREIAAGQNHVCARVPPSSGTGSLACWGSNHHGHLGDGTTTNRDAPVASMASTASALGLGQQHSCGVVGSAVDCWGWSASGQVGVLTETNPTPHTVSIFAADANPTEVEGGDSFSCVIRGGAIGCWGSNSLGQLGDSTAGASRLNATTSIPGIANARGLSAGGDTACVLRGEAGVVNCWGDNGRGQVGGTGTPVAAPRPVLTGPGVGGLEATDVSVGPSHVCAVLPTGRVSCWGHNALGALGDPGIPTGFVEGAIVRFPNPVVGLP